MNVTFAKERLIKVFGHDRDRDISPRAVKRFSDFVSALLEFPETLRMAISNIPGFYKF